MHNRWWPNVINCCAMAKPMPREAPVKMVRCCFMAKILAKSALPHVARYDSSMPLRGTYAVDLQRRDFAGLVAPLGAQVREHRCNVAIVQFQHRWRHAERPRVRCRGRAIAAVQHHLHQIGRVGAIQRGCQREPGRRFFPWQWSRLGLARHGIERNAARRL